jgi:hypothetical protein
MQKEGYYLTVVLGDVSALTANSACQIDSSAFLIDYNNCNEFLVSSLSKNTTVFTSLGDLPNDVKVVWDLLWNADEIVYCPPEKWSDNKKIIDITNPTECIQGLTESLLLHLPSSKHIKNFNRISLTQNPIELVDHRKSINPQLWSVGCSFTHGVGVDQVERYGQRVATVLNKECSFLTRPGSAIDWASDQIIRSDIQAGDIVIWGITVTERVTFVHNDLLVPGVNNRTYSYIRDLDSILPKKILLHQNTLYDHIYSIERAINFCNKVQAKLILFGIFPSENMLRYLSGSPYYYHYQYKKIFKNNTISNVFEDFGSDNEHPGPAQHKLYADFILDLIQ